MVGGSENSQKPRTASRCRCDPEDVDGVEREKISLALAEII
jgi:hypothetical protein